MAKTDDIIDRLVKDLEPVRKGALHRLLMRALVSGFALSSAIILLGHGLRPDLSVALAQAAFWAKSAYPLLLSIVGVVALIKVARPGGRPTGAALQVLVIYMLLTILGLLQLNAAAPAEHIRLIMGISYWFCPLIILAAGAPLMAATFLFLRRAAPTQPRLAGFVAGATAGSIGAWVYSWGCTENGLTFVALWYTLGILLCGLIGASLGKRLLRW
ncbi:hypothetical protein ASE04_19595 [Rhizobium sp. Root708]|uniref:DUF1109 domain-containing protein n=1 Tax=Rhizobium sp. Root708 TaxID=1736592 RepID=UPI0006F501F7|nr:DUF1109 domain-containing protein [Rhizobium sp. Root708]KRB62086.1 hypothetical protein ASE04_19595 [Rhizobium sp. Root708]